MRTILLLSVAVAIGIACSEWRAQPPENAYPYADETLARFRKLVEGDGWRDPAWNAQGALEATHEKTGLVFVLIPGTGPGGFMMGSPDEEGGRNDNEMQHRVTVGAFLLCNTECTQAAWDVVGGEDKRRLPAGANLPIEGVSWNEVSAWCGKAGLRLPSETEWEYACRAGTTTSYWSGDAEEDLARLFGLASSYGGAHGVGKKRANPFGLYDMHGNAWEWCADKYRHSHDGAPEDGTARVQEGAVRRVYRGGSWRLYTQGARSAYRTRTRPDFRGFFLGFRPARSFTTE